MLVDARGIFDVQDKYKVTNDFSYTAIKTIEWAEQCGIFEKATKQTQFIKLVEEVGEVAECVSKGKHEEIKGEIGDLLVTVILLAKMEGYTVDECLQDAYNKISKRTGQMVDGFFVKD